jgi:hypothetical protein
LGDKIYEMRGTEILTEVGVEIGCGLHSELQNGIVWGHALGFTFCAARWGRLEDTGFAFLEEREEHPTKELGRLALFFTLTQLPLSSAPTVVIIDPSP